MNTTTTTTTTTTSTTNNQATNPSQTASAVTLGQATSPRATLTITLDKFPTLCSSESSHDWSTPLRLETSGDLSELDDILTFLKTHTILANAITELATNRLYDHQTARNLLITILPNLSRLYINICFSFKQNSELIKSLKNLDALTIEKAYAHTSMPNPAQKKPVWSKIIEQKNTEMPTEALMLEVRTRKQSLLLLSLLHQHHSAQ